MVHDKPTLTACNGKVNPTEHYPGAMFHGEPVYFCTMACLLAFESDPERFMAGEIEHPHDEE